MRAIVVLLVAMSSFCGPAFAQPDLTAGERDYQVCAGCHGFVGEGNELVGAPRLAGLEPSYLERQIENFRAGRRGHVDGDVKGQRMATMAKAVANDRELADLVAFIATLPAPERPASVDGDAVRGQTLYAVCSACHGPEAAGNEALGAPGLVGLDDWYVVEQLAAYADGLRGVDPGDTYGAQMRALSATFASDDDRRALAAYINSLKR